MTYFETEQDLIRERKAIEKFVSIFGGSYQKLSDHDVDYKVFDKDKNLIAYVEVKGRMRRLYNAYPLPISCKKLIKLVDKRLNPTVIWACEDGIIYGKVKEIRGDIRYNGRKPRDGAPNDHELIAYFERQKVFKYVRYT
jgi:hypothetical protein